MKNLQKFEKDQLTHQEAKQLKGGEREHRRVRRVGVTLRRRRSSN